MMHDTCKCWLNTLTTSINTPCGPLLTRAPLNNVDSIIKQCQMVVKFRSHRNKMYTRINRFCTSFNMKEPGIISGTKFTFANLLDEK